MFGQVCNLLLKPLTSRSKCSLCEDSMAAGSGGVGRATVVLSHSWRSLFDDSVDAAIEAVEDGSSSNQVSPSVSSAACCWLQRYVIVQQQQSHLASSQPKQAAAFIWIDVFCHRQHDVPQDSSAPTSVVARMSEVISKTGSLALMLHPFDDPLSLKRAWCVHSTILQTCSALPICYHGSHPVLLFSKQVHLRTVLLYSQWLQNDRHADACRERSIC
jgi:hypothetical protein